MKVGGGFCSLLICCFAWYAEAKVLQGFFVPEDIQTILNLAYSRLPPVKLGSDKRYGVGFRLGRNADFQILVELGPQSDTVPLVEPSNSLSKRENRHKKYGLWEKPKMVGSKAFVHKTAVSKPPINKVSYYKKEGASLNSVVGTEKHYPTILKELYKHSTTTTTTSEQTTISKISDSTTTISKIADTTIISKIPDSKTTISKIPDSTTTISKIADTTIISKIPDSKTTINKIPDTTTTISKIPNTKTVISKIPNSKTVISKIPNNKSSSKISNSKTNSIEKSPSKKPREVQNQKKPDTFYDMFFKWLTRLTGI